MRDLKAQLRETGVYVAAKAQVAGREVGVDQPATVDVVRTTTAPNAVCTRPSLRIPSQPSGLIAAP